MSRQPSRPVSLAGLRLTRLLEQSILIHLALVYLLGQAGLAWGWPATAPLWLGGLLTLSVASWIVGGLRLAVVVSLLSGAFLSATSPSTESTLPIFRRTTSGSSLCRRKSSSKVGYSRSRSGVRPVAGCILRRNASGKTGSPGQQRQGPRHRSSFPRPQRPLAIRRCDEAYAQAPHPAQFQTPGSFDYAGYLARRGIYLTAFVWDDKNIEKDGLAGTWLRSLD